MSGVYFIKLYFRKWGVRYGKKDSSSEREKKG